MKKNDLEREPGRSHHPHRPTVRPSSAKAATRSSRPSARQIRRRPVTATGTVAKHVPVGTARPGGNNVQRIRFTAHTETRSVNPGARSSHRAGGTSQTSSKARSENSSERRVRTKGPCSALEATWDPEGESTGTWDKGCCWHEHEDLTPDPRVMQKVEEFVAQILHKSSDQQDRRCGAKRNSASRAPLDPTSHVYGAGTSNSLVTSGMLYSVGECPRGSRITRANGKTNRLGNKRHTRVNASVTEQDEAKGVGVKDELPFPAADKDGTEAGGGTVDHVESTLKAQARRGSSSSETDQGESACNGTHAAAPSPQPKNTLDTKAEAGKTIMHINPRALDVLCSMRPTLERKANVRGSSRHRTLRKRHRCPAINNHVHGDRPPPQPPPQQSLFVEGKVCSWTSIFGATNAGASRGRARVDVLEAARQVARQSMRRELCSATKITTALATEETVKVVTTVDNKEVWPSQENGKVIAGLVGKMPYENVRQDAIDGLHGDSVACEITDGTVDITEAPRLEDDNIHDSNDTDRGPQGLFSSCVREELTIDDKTGTINDKTETLNTPESAKCAQSSGEPSVLSPSGAIERLRRTFQTTATSRKSAGRGATLTGVSASRSLQLYPEANKFLSGITPVFFPLRSHPERSGDSLGGTGGRPRCRGGSNRRPWTASGAYGYGRCKASGTRLEGYGDHSSDRTCDRRRISRRPWTAAGTFGFDRGDTGVEGDDSAGSQVASVRPGAAGAGLPYGPGKRDDVLIITTASR